MKLTIEHDGETTAYHGIGPILIVGHYVNGAGIVTPLRILPANPILLAELIETARINGEARCK